MVILLTADCATVLGVLPVLPAAFGLFWIILSTLGGLLLASLTMRRQAGRKLLRGLWRQKWGLLVLILVVTGAVRLTSWLRTPTAVVLEPPPWREASWPAFRGSQERSGHADHLTGPTRGGVKWTGGRGFEFLATPAVAGAEIVAIGNRNDRARLFAWNALTGRAIPLPVVENWEPTFSSVAISDGLIVCGEGLHDTPDCLIRCFDVTAGPHWQTPFVFATSGHIECTPVLIGDRIYFGAGSDGIYCLAVDRLNRKLNLNWHVRGDDFPDAETSLAVHDGRVYAGLGTGGEALCILDAFTGREVRRLPLSWPAFSPPAIANGRLYVGAGQADYVHDGSSSGEVVCYRLDTLEQAWSFTTPAAVLSAIVADRGQVLVTAVNGDLFVLDANGHELGHWTSGVRTLTAPAVTEDRIYCVATDGLLTALDRTSLQSVWKLVLGKPGRYVSSPVVAHGHVYVGTPHDGLICAGEPR